ncbi:MAG TPA: ferritin-like domain-containing protein [Sphingomicrobium sp.]
MVDDTLLMEALDARVERRNHRRDFFKTMGAGAAVAIGGGLYLANAPGAVAQTAPTDQDILNFALNLEYLEAQFYSFAVTGSGLPSNVLGGTGTPGPAQVTGGRQVNFTDPVVRQHALEITANENAHVNFVRNTLGSAAIAQPTLDLRVAVDSAFSMAARSAGLIGPNQVFDPYSSDENFLLGAFLLEDVGVTAYKGAAALISSKAILEASAGILAVEAYHSAILRTNLYTKGLAAPSLMSATEAISNARDSLDGPTNLDQGVAMVNGASNIAPLDENAIAFGRTTGQVLNIAYLTRAAVSAGGFFPQGVNGPIRTSAAN